MSNLNDVEAVQDSVNREHASSNACLYQIMLLLFGKIFFVGNDARTIRSSCPDAGNGRRMAGPAFCLSETNVLCDEIFLLRYEVYVFLRDPSRDGCCASEAQ